MSNAVYGLAVAAFLTGAIAAGPAAGALVRGFGSARAAVVSTLLTALGVLAADTAGSVPVFAAALFLAGAMDAVTDVALYAHGLRVQRRYGRSIINSLHAIWSVGAATGGAMAAGAISLDLTRGRHLTVSAVAFGAGACLAQRYCLPGPDTGPEADGHEDRQPRRTGTARRTAYALTALVLIATAGTLVEDAAGLRLGLLVVPLAGVLLVLFAGALRPREH